MDPLHEDIEPGLPGSELRGSMSMLRRRSKILVASLLLGVAAGAAYTVLAPKSYQATSTVALRNISAAPFSGTDQQSGAVVDNQTEQLVASSLVVAQLAQRQLGTATSPADLLANLTVTAPAKTAILIFSYTAPSARGAVSGADAFADSYLRYSTNQARGLQTQAVTSLGARLSDLDQQVAKLEATLATAPHGSAQASQAQALLSLQNAELNSLRNAIAADQSVVLDPGKVVAAAVLPTSASSPKAALGLGGGALLGLVIGLLVAAWRDRTDDRLRRRGALEGQLGPRPVLLEVAPRGGRPDPLELAAAGSPLDGAVSEVCARLVLAGMSPGFVLAVSPLPGTSPDHNTAVLLAAGIAGTGCVTVLVRADAAGGQVGEVDTEAELAELTSGTGAVERALRPVEGANRLLMLDLSALTGAASTVATVLAELRSRGYVVVAALGRADQARTLLAGAGADSAVLVATAGRTRVADVRAAADGFEDAGIPVIGLVVLNRVDTRASDRPASWVGSGRGGHPSGQRAAESGRRGQHSDPLAPAGA